jgi:hypothetical protein
MLHLLTGCILLLFLVAYGCFMWQCGRVGNHASDYSTETPMKTLETPAMQPIPSPRSSTLATTAQVQGMIAALEKLPTVTVDKDWPSGTVVASYTKKGVTTCLMRALQKGHNQPWIVTHPRDLFE